MLPSKSLQASKENTRRQTKSLPESTAGWTTQGAAVCNG